MNIKPLERDYNLSDSELALFAYEIFTNSFSKTSKGRRSVSLALSWSLLPSWHIRSHQTFFLSPDASDRSCRHATKLPLWYKAVRS